VWFYYNYVQSGGYSRVNDTVYAAGNSMEHNNGAQFSTKDKDNDKAPDGSCAVRYTGSGGSTCVVMPS